jgi:hypothetical protein
MITTKLAINMLFLKGAFEYRVSCIALRHEAHFGTFLESVCSRFVDFIGLSRSGTSIEHLLSELKTIMKSNLQNTSETTMKKSITILALTVLSFVLVQSAMAQSGTATQSVSLTVNAVYKISTSGPVSLTINNGTAGTDALTAATDNSSTYNMTQNSATPAKITAGLNTALTAGYSLSIALASTKGTSAGAVDISNAVAKDVVTAMAKGADASQMITYTFGANASAGILSTLAKTVTLTLTN